MWNPPVMDASAAIATSWTILLPSAATTWGSLQTLHDDTILQNAPRCWFCSDLGVFQTPHRRLPMSLCSIPPKLPSSSRLETRCRVHLSYAPWRPPLNDSSWAPCDALLNALLNIPPADAQLECAFLDALVWSTPTETQSWAHVWTPVKLGCICRSSAEVYRSSL